jgi:Zn-dependent M28 family amino/carboxypeptidase
LPQLVLSKAALAALLDGESTTADALLAADVSHHYGESFALGRGKAVTLRLAADSDDTDAYNVAGIIDGADRVLKDEYLTVSSHLDGAIGRATSGDTIYNAADDNASGSAGNLAIARAFMQGPPPKRSIVLIWDTGEETGLWGSRHVAYGDISKRIVAHTCVDMIGRTKAPGSNLPAQQDLAGPGEVFVAGPGVLSTGMDRALARVAREFPYATQNRKFDNAAESFFYPRTDAAPYFERRIPYVEFFTGLHEDYHRPSDEVSKIDPAKMEAVARTVYTFVSTLADDPVRPRMDKPLPPNLVALLAR